MMRVSVDTHIDAAPEVVWPLVADIKNSADTIKAIEEVEVLEEATGPSLRGLKWRETRTMFGKRATEVMWVTDAKDLEFYQTRAESHGAVYRARVALKPEEGGTRLSMGFEGTPQTFFARLMWGLTGFMFKGATRKALAADLDDIKARAEGSK